MTRVDLSEIAYNPETPKKTEFYNPPEAEVTYEIDTDMAKVDADLYRQYQKRAEVLNTYLALTEDPKEMDEQMRIVTFSKLSYGLRKAGEALAWATFHQKVAYASRKEAEGLAALEDFPNYVNKKESSGEKVKVTNDSRTYYVPINPRVLMASKREALANAILEHFSTIRVQFIQGISTLRSLSYGVKDSNYMSSSAVSVTERSF